MDYMEQWFVIHWNQTKMTWQYHERSNHFTAWKVSKYKVFSGPYFPVFSPNTGKYEIEGTPYSDNFHAVFADVFQNKGS